MTHYVKRGPPINGEALCIMGDSEPAGERLALLGESREGRMFRGSSSQGLELTHRAFSQGSDMITLYHLRGGNVAARE